jgi:hypothetical protein
MDPDIIDGLAIEVAAVDLLEPVVHDQRTSRRCADCSRSVAGSLERARVQGGDSVVAERPRDERCFLRPLVAERGVRPSAHAHARSRSVRESVAMTDEDEPGAAGVQHTSVTLDGTEFLPTIQT